MDALYIEHSDIVFRRQIPRGVSLVVITQTRPLYRALLQLPDLFTMPNLRILFSDTVRELSVVPEHGQQITGVPFCWSGPQTLSFSFDKRSQIWHAASNAPGGNQTPAFSATSLLDFRTGSAALL